MKFSNACGKLCIAFTSVHTHVYVAEKDSLSTHYVRSYILEINPCSLIFTNESTVNWP